jgi:hypothetical protein
MSSDLRDASTKINGYYYQRLYAIKIILEHIDDTNKIENMRVLEEGDEDIDIIDNSNFKIITQIKYHNTDNPPSESLTKKSGLYKVIGGNWKKNKIKKIVYKVYSKNNSPYSDIKTHFDDKNYEYIEKLFLLLHIKRNKEDHIKNNNSIIRINNIFNKYKNEIKKDNTELYNFFTDTLQCTEYFSKFSLESAESHQNLDDYIIQKIKLKYKNFIDIDGQTEEFKTMKTRIIKNYINDQLINKMILHDTDQNKRQIKLKELCSNIENYINKFTNQKSLFIEYLNTIDIDEKYIRDNNDDFKHLCNNLICNIVILTRIDISQYDICKAIEKSLNVVRKLEKNKNQNMELNILVSKLIFKSCKNISLNDEEYVEMVRHNADIIKKITKKREREVGKLSHKKYAIKIMELYKDRDMDNITIKKINNKKISKVKKI